MDCGYRDYIIFIRIFNIHICTCDSDVTVCMPNCMSMTEYSLWYVYKYNMRKKTGKCFRKCVRLEMLKKNGMRLIRPWWFSMCAILSNAHVCIVCNVYMRFQAKFTQGDNFLRTLRRIDRIICGNNMPEWIYLYIFSGFRLLNDDTFPCCIAVYIFYQWYGKPMFSF